MFKNVSYEDRKIKKEWIQPVLCNDLYKDDNSWNEMKNVIDGLVCPNTKEISLSYNYKNHNFR